MRRGLSSSRTRSRVLVLAERADDRIFGSRGRCPSRRPLVAFRRVTDLLRTTTARRALVTGAARGLGRAIAIALADHGFDVALVDRVRDVETANVEMSKPADLDEAAEQVRSRGRRAAAIPGDVTVEADVRSAVEQTVKELGGLDAVVANAGIWSTGKVWELTERQWDDMLAVNLKGAWLTAKHTLPTMIAQESGTIIFISSIDGLRAEADYAHYVAAKHGVIGLMKAVALEVGEANVTANAVCPTNLRTDMVMSAAGTEFFAGSGGDVEGAVGSANLLPGRGALAPEDVAEVVAWLASPAARHITGHALPVDAGWIAKRGG
jgi:NAD(P)-dependent dehydrogenase (short-subunit alcohol dehydrogenase family)